MSTTNTLRDRSDPGQARVHFIELFFDLVFVFAVTRLSHGLIEHPSLEGALQIGFLTIAVWGVWMWTTWAANWLNPAAVPVQLMMIALMAVGLVMSTSIPDAFGDAGLVFALAFASMQNGRNAFTVWALRNGEPNHRRNFIRIQVWLLASGVLWVAGGLASGEMRWVLWLGALFLELGSPWWLFWTPGMGRSTTADWSVDAGHMAERCGLFVILALGESIIVLGTTFVRLEQTTAVIAAFAICFLGSVAMWWVYFVIAAEAADEAFAHHDDRGRIARAAYTYAHIPLVAGIIAIAVSDEMVLSHPDGHVDVFTAGVALGGAGLFLGGTILFNRLTRGVWLTSHLAGLLVLVACAFFATSTTQVVVSGIATGVLVIVAAWETLAGQRRRPVPAAH